MGIKNFCKLIEPLAPPEPPQCFDSILVDVQGFLYTAIESCLETDENRIMQEICKISWEILLKTLNDLFSHNVHSKDLCTLVLAFDGEGVPMKWPTQRQRRSKVQDIRGKDLYRYSLFGKNKISLRVERFIRLQLKKFFETCWFKFQIEMLDVIICGCKVTGEGEHKLFQVAEKLPFQCRRPVIVSVDQDVFVLALMRIDRYDTLQIYRYKNFYNVNRYLIQNLPYEPSRLIAVTNLFGNDFIPALVGITAINAPTIHANLSPDDNDNEEGNNNNEAHVVANFICKMEKHLRFERTPHVDRSLIESYWMTHLWIKDYYKLRNFKQKYLENSIFDSFDRNQLLTGLSNAVYSSSVLQDVLRKYENLVSTPVDETQIVKKIFVNENVLKKLEKFWERGQQENAPCLKILFKKN